MPRNHSGNQRPNPNDAMKVSIVGKAPIEFDPKSLQDISKAIREQTATQQNAGNASDGISKLAIQEQKRANQNSQLATYLSGASLAATVIVIVLNFRAINAAVKSANAADSTVAEYRREFKELNDPFLEISDINVKFNDTLKKMIFNYNLLNLKSSPAQIVNKKEDILYIRNHPIDPETEFARLEKMQLDTTANGSNAYVIKDAPKHFTTTEGFGNKPGDASYEQLKRGDFDAYMVEIVRYQDLVANSTRLFRCIIRITVQSPNERFIEYVYNKNTDFIDGQSKN